MRHGAILLLALVLLSLPAHATTLRVTDGWVSTGALNDFAAIMQIEGKHFSLSTGRTDGGVSSDAFLFIRQAGDPATLSSEVRLWRGAFALHGTPYEFVGFDHALTFTTEPIVLPEAGCPTFPCPLPTATFSVPFTMSGELLVGNDQNQPITVKLHGEGTATGTFISPALPPDTAWHASGITYAFEDPRGPSGDGPPGLSQAVHPSVLLVPEPQSLVLLVSGSSVWLLWRGLPRRRRAGTQAIMQAGHE